MVAEKLLKLLGIGSTQPLSYEALLDTMLEILEVDHVCLILIDPHGDLTFHSKPPMAVNTSIVRRAIYQKQSLLVMADAVVNAHVRDTINHSQLNLPSITCAPLMINDHVFGALYIENRSYSFSDEQLELFKHLTAQISLIICVQQEINRREKLEQKLSELIVERERTQALYQFLRDVSHKLRSPLTVIQTSLSVINRICSASAIERPITQAKAGVSNIVRLLDLLVYAVRLDVTDTSGIRRINLDQTVASVVTELQERASKQDVHLEVVSHTRPLEIIGDETEIALMINELLINAICFSKPKCKIQINIIDKNLFRVLEITDTGIGIPPDHLPLIFNRFFCTEDTNGSRGYGLGLSLVKRVVERHHAKVEIESVVGQGTTFRISFPTLNHHIGI